MQRDSKRRRISRDRSPRIDRALRRLSPIQLSADPGVTTSSNLVPSLQESLREDSQVFLRTADLTLGDGEHDLHFDVHLRLRPGEPTERWGDLFEGDRVSSSTAVGSAIRASEESPSSFWRLCAELAPPGVWTLWGPPELETVLAGSGARIVAAERLRRRSSPRSAAHSQCPRGDVVLWMHAVRPLVARRSVHASSRPDTRPLGRGSGERAWRRFFARVAAGTATTVAVIPTRLSASWRGSSGSSHTEKVAYPLDRRPGGRGSGHCASGGGVIRRSSRGCSMSGQVKPHKNLRRAVDGYFASDFSKTGGCYLPGRWRDRASELSEIQALKLVSRPDESRDPPRMQPTPSLIELYVVGVVPDTALPGGGFRTSRCGSACGRAPGLLQRHRRPARGRSRHERRLFDLDFGLAIGDVRSTTRSSGAAGRVGSRIPQYADASQTSRASSLDCSKVSTRSGGVGERVKLGEQIRPSERPSSACSTSAT